MEPSLFIRLNFCNKISEHGIRIAVGVSTYVSGSKNESTDLLSFIKVTGTLSKQNLSVLSTASVCIHFMAYKTLPDLTKKRASFEI